MPKLYKIEPGQRFQNLTFIADSEKGNTFNKYGLFRCDCGETCEHRISSAVHKYVFSCRACTYGIRAIYASRFLIFAELALQKKMSITDAAKAIYVIPSNFNRWLRIVEAKGIKGFSAVRRDVDAAEFERRYKEITKLS